MPDVGDAWARFTRGDFRGAADLSHKLLVLSPGRGRRFSVCNAVSNWQLGADIDCVRRDHAGAVSLAPKTPDLQILRRFSPRRQRSLLTHCKQIIAGSSGLEYQQLMA